MTVLSVGQGHKVDSVLQQAIKHNWSIFETRSRIKKINSLTVDLRTLVRRANRVFNYQFFEGDSELTEVQLLQI